MQLSHITAFWLRLAGNILLDLFLHVHMFRSPVATHEIIGRLTVLLLAKGEHGPLRSLDSEGAYGLLRLARVSLIVVEDRPLIFTRSAGSIFLNAGRTFAWNSSRRRSTYSAGGAPFEASTNQGGPSFAPFARVGFPSVNTRRF
jgi:hypothetical protein